ncbi:MAG: hypothetical protein WC710_12900 [Gallionella sp.]
MKTNPLHRSLITPPLRMVRFSGTAFIDDIEALRQAWHEKRMSSDEIWHYAKICRVANVMRPYLESLS